MADVSSPRRQGGDNCGQTGGAMVMEMGYEIATLMTVKQVANRLKLSVRSIWRRVQRGRLPAPLYPWPKAPRWPRDAIEQAAHVKRTGEVG